jgi:Domain of unknown function (DUF4145)
MPTDAIATKAHCNLCGGERNHAVLHSIATEWESEDSQIGGKDRYETLQCAGCESIKLRHTIDHSWEQDVTVIYYPPSISRARPRWYGDLIFDLTLDEDAISDLLEEIYVGLQNGLKRSPVMAARSLLERVMLSKCGDKFSFAKNLEAFASAGYVSKAQAERLLAILEAGHATTHRDYTPTREDIETIVDIIEHVVESVYIHDRKVAALKGRTPPRTR